MAENLSLFGWPVVEPREKAGRPEHEATAENRNKVMMMLAFKMTNAEIGKALGVSQPTLRKHYLQELGQRRAALLQLKATRWSVLYQKAIVEQDTSAIKELGREIDKHDLVELSAAFGRAKPEKKQRLGKKEQAQVDAQAVGQDSDWGEDLLPNAGKPN